MCRRIPDVAATCFPVSAVPRPVPAYPPNPVKAAWFFVALQATLSYSVKWAELDLCQSLEDHQKCYSNGERN
jgi:hypothetical protein